MSETPTKQLAGSWARRHRVVWLVMCMSFVVVWVVCNFWLTESDSFFFSNFLRLPLETCAHLLFIGTSAFSVWVDMWYTPLWRQVLMIAYATLGFLPLAVYAFVSRKWLLWLTAAFILAHPAVWLLAFAVNIAFAHH